MSCKRLYNLRNTVRVVFTALSTLAFDCIGACKLQDCCRG
nr:MAG TPA: hypothetical protein [Caudoviricetes sp.]